MDHFYWLAWRATSFSTEYKRAPTQSDILLKSNIRNGFRTWLIFFGCTLIFYKSVDVYLASKRDFFDLITSDLLYRLDGRYLSVMWYRKFSVCTFIKYKCSGNTYCSIDIYFYIWFIKFWYFRIVFIVRLCNKLWKNKYYIVPK